ncbi:hypothetical protein B5C34_11465 [Pacificimonas flava]|uniref:histidine kinase n=2 Tax=Pacificimonas TaxID=1960290 RepID=A0A219B6N4_9SPHN|nr:MULTISPECIES: HAMP domain-containing sensor histidine kinase [Pacificimonas]MBZ6378714.1 HAMP domain-containing histidine kinase [Pacificimonas aurantium]OWV34017.1 hypothetical protein B5C34_11465 [Pacificimonas flava]
MLIDLPTKNPADETRWRTKRPPMGLERPFQSHIDTIRAQADRLGAHADKGAHPHYARYARDIREAATHLSGVTDEFTAVGANRQQRGKVDLGRMLDDVATLIQPLAAARQITLEWPARQTAAPIVAGASLRVRQAILNVMSNALKFAPSESPVRVEMSEEDGRVSLAVSDTGPGIPDDDRARVFDRYERLTSEADGMGLGLSISRDYMRSIGGDIHVGDSRMGGATVILFFRKTEG